LSIFYRLSKHPRSVGAVLLALILIFSWQIAGSARLETNLDEYMPSEHPAFMASGELEELFGITDAVLLVIEHPQTLYNQGTLEKIKEITLSLPEKFTEIDPSGIVSLYSAENIIGSDWGMEVEPFYPASFSDPASLLEIEQKVQDNSMISGKIVSNDGRSALIIAEISGDSFSQEFYQELKKFALEFEGPETVRIAGRPVVEGELSILGPRDMSRMAPLVLLLMAIILFILLRSVRDTVINLFIVLFGTITAFGAKSLLGIPIYSVDMMMPVMLIAIGVAYGIHMHNTLYHLAAEFPDITREELVKKNLKAMLRPVIMTGLTTAVGFAALTTSQVLPVRYFGLFIALGVLVEMFLALVLFPASVLLFGPVKKRRMFGSKNENPVPTGKIVSNKREKILARPWLVLLTTGVIVILAGWGTTRVWIDTSFLANFQEESSIAQTDKFVNDNFGGTSTFQVVFTGKEPDVFKEPRILKTVSSLQQEIGLNPLVGNSFGLTDYISRMHRVMNNNLPEFDVIPEDRDLIAQYLLIYEMSGDPDNLNKVVDFDYQTLNLTFQLKSDSSSLITRIINQIEMEKTALSDLGLEVSYAGSGYKSYIFSKLLLEGQVWSLGISFVIVLILLSLMFRSLLLGLIGTIPIAITAIVNFGAMGIFGIPLSSATALISSIAVGIGVDYAIHLIEHYIIRRSEGDSIDHAALETLHNTGRAVVFNAITIMGGFGVLLFSVFPPNRQVGGLVGLNMAVSAVGTLTVLMVLLKILDSRGRLPYSQRKQK
jgi:uncharacterized protein